MAHKRVKNPRGVSKGGVIVPVELTSTWIPLSLLAVLCAYMFILFLRERKEAHAYEAELAAGGGTMSVSHDAGGSHAGEGAHVQSAAAHGHDAHAGAASAKGKRKQSLKWRTAHLWLPIVAGFGWQAYLDFGKAMIEKASH